MSINIDNLEIDELLELNKTIVNRIKKLRNQNELEAASKFRIGNIVSFTKEDGTKEIGIIMGIRKKMISILAESHKQWNVSPSILNLEEKPSKDLLIVLNELIGIKRL